jgi:quercetin 2,3-dioxygenase
MKNVQGILHAPAGHWVGDGFPVRSLFSYHSHAAAVSPFLLLDYAGPAEFGPAERPRGVGEHPHRGFETVTIVYQGEVEHRDSGGGGGRIGPGDVQWMTAAAGVVHDEFHSREFTRNGGTLEMVQLWVNLPAAKKMSTPRYQPIVDSDIPVVPLADDAGRVRVIAGTFAGSNGPARTHTPMNVWDVRLRAGHGADFELADGWTTLAVVLHGSIRANGGDTAGEAQLVAFDRAGSRVTIEALEDATVLLLSGEPIDEPIAGYGPFVMNTQDEIRQAITDFNSGRFGQLPT